MAKKSKSGAERQLEDALAARQLADPRPGLRERLKLLRETNPSAFEQARTRFESVVSDDMASGDVLASWVEYGRLLGELTGEGRLMHVDETGRAVTWSASEGPGSLLLHLPRDVAVPALVVLAPAEPSAAQQATVDLLANRRLAL